MITTFQLLATIFPCVSTLTIDDKFIRDLVNSQGLEQCDFGYVTDYKESKIVNQIFADEIDERLLIVLIMSRFMNLQNTLPNTLTGQS